MCLSLIMAAFGLVALVKGEVKVTRNRRLTGTISRVLGLLLLAGAAAPLLIEGGGVISIGVFLFTILVGLLAAEPIGTQVRRREPVAVPASQSSYSSPYNPLSSSLQWRLGNPARNESSRLRPMLIFLVCLALLVAVLLVAGKSANGLLPTSQTTSSNVMATKPSASADRLMVAQDGTFQISVPNDWQEVTGLNDTAQLQVASGHHDAFLMVLSGDKKDFKGFMDYTKFTTSQFSKVFGTATVEGPTNLTVNGNKAIQYKIFSLMSGVKATTLFTIIEGQNNYFQVMAWTTSSKFDNLEALLQHTVLSFRDEPGNQ